MPQINRIRVNNVKYNFGTQYYDDFMMRFNCKNTIYDLANGGGKSLLMLLLLQNVIPNCTLDDKQPIEKLFREDSGNTVIHSLVEWKLDSCYRQDGYKYMTTGFCARKGRGDNESDSDENANLMESLKTGQDAEMLNKRDSNASSNIEYFNYCIFYREFNDNDIKNLPLVSNGERITYNGLKAYLRDLEKNDFNVSVKIFDRKGEYQSFISKYGLYESEWEIIRGINKTEGHVRTYFETNYKTSRKVVEDLFIEEIIQKSFNNKLAVENDEQKMAKTLFDIKDKLMELSKKHSCMDNYDMQIEAVNEFSSYVEGYKGMFLKKEELKNTLLDMLIVCAKTLESKQEEHKKTEMDIEKIGHDIMLEQKSIMTAEVMCEQKSADALNKALELKENEKVQQKNVFNDLKKKLSLMECANDYSDYLNYREEADTIAQIISNSSRDHAEIIDELKDLAALYRPFYDEKRTELSNNLQIKEASFKQRQNEYNDAQANLKSVEKEALVKEGLIQVTKENISKQEERLAAAMQKAGILVAENALDDLAKLEEKLKDTEYKLNISKKREESFNEDVKECNNKLAGVLAKEDILSENLSKCRNNVDDLNSYNEKIDDLKNIYRKNELSELALEILETFKAMDIDRNDIKLKKKEITEFIENAQNGTYVCNDPKREKLKQYLVNQYGDDVIEGHEWFRNLNPGQKRDVYKRAPFAEYSFVIKNDFERIRNDKILENFERGAYVIPIISEQVLMDTKLEVNKELVVFAMKNMDFLRDDARCEAEIRSAYEELKGLEDKLIKLNDRCDVVWEDYTFVIGYIASKNVRCGDSPEMIEEELEAAKVIQSEYENNLNRLKENLLKEKERKSLLEQEVQLVNKQIAEQKNVAKMYEDIQESYRELAQYESEEEKSKECLAQLSGDIQDVKLLLESEKEKYDSIKISYENVIKEWDELYSCYYDEKHVSKKDISIFDNDIDNLKKKFKGLSALINTNSTDLEDKKALISHYHMSMEKCIKSIEYRGSSLEEIGHFVETSSCRYYDSDKLRKVKEKLDEIDASIGTIKQEIDAQSALANRLLGSISHGISRIEEKYGDYVPFECDNPDNFIKQHKQNVSELKKQAEEFKKQLKETDKNMQNLVICKKDLERIVKSAGITVPDENIVKYTDDADLNEKQIDISDYEEVAKEFEKLIKLEYRKFDEFEKHKKILVDKLNKYDASELARQVEISVNMPENAEKTDELVNNLKETNSFIVLEKERVASGIEQMEQIKENFEIRCIQTCSNIKSQLDRLSKLSNINMDGENISIIGLHIPYVKEELYAERMSDYIDETVMIADSFESVDERLKYIRNRLTWKRLFSVIVTDMNSIRINLYKRERIKDQSRYLRYEEAVGSTGQSQGIYIQFLIAVINYISSINASSGENAILGKTIFIDNPFGAAKDIYIWEPIFKLLKVNHVQLIVPARGATPAITGRFDVNYILGQKLVGKRMQTVVVDYFSNTDSTQMEYTRMEYEQVSLNFV